MDIKSIIKTEWEVLRENLAAHFDHEKPSMETILFLIGVQELGKGAQKFSKRQKEELMHIAVCRLFSTLGYYALKGLDNEGWPHWELVTPIPYTSALQQEELMKSLIITYFNDLFSIKTQSHGQA